MISCIKHDSKNQHHLTYYSLAFLYLKYTVNLNYFLVPICRHISKQTVLWLHTQSTLHIKIQRHFSCLSTGDSSFCHQSTKATMTQCYWRRRVMCTNAFATGFECFLCLLVLVLPFELDYKRGCLNTGWQCTLVSEYKFQQFIFSSCFSFSLHCAAFHTFFTDYDFFCAVDVKSLFPVRIQCTLDTFW